jgi:hypothetical protein
MELFHHEDGWLPLDVLHPRFTGRSKLSAGDWDDVCKAARCALEKIHQLKLPIPGKPGEEGSLVWGDSRLANWLAKYFKQQKQWRVIALDFDWAGVAGVTRYPCTMNHQLQWQAGAGPDELMQQAQDTELLEHQLTVGGDFYVSDMGTLRKRRRVSSSLAVGVSNEQQQLQQQ